MNPKVGRRNSVAIERNVQNNSIMFVCLEFSSAREFSHLETLPWPVKGNKFFNYTRHSWPLSCEDSLTCNTYCDTGQSFITVICEDHDTHTWCRAFGSGAVINGFNDFGLSRTRIEPRFTACEANALPLSHSGSYSYDFPTCLICFALTLYVHYC